MNIDKHVNLQNSFGSDENRVRDSHHHYEEPCLNRPPVSMAIAAIDKPLNTFAAVAAVSPPAPLMPKRQRHAPLASHGSPKANHHHTPPPPLHQQQSQNSIVRHRTPNDQNADELRIRSAPRSRLTDAQVRQHLSSSLFVIAGA